MKTRLMVIVSFALILSLALAGCTGSNQPSSQPSSQTPAPSSSQENTNTNDVESDGDPAERADELVVRFGDSGKSFTMHLEDNETAAAIARHVGTSDWRLPIYHYDESDVMQYYDIPSRYDIPSDPTTVTSALAGDVYYSDPNRIVLYYHDAEISEEYTKIGAFDATEEFVSAVENNPVLEGWGNKIVVISDGN